MPPPSDAADMSFVDVLAGDKGDAGMHASGPSHSWMSRTTFSFVSRIVYAAKRKGRLDVADISKAPSQYECRRTSEAITAQLTYTNKKGDAQTRSMFMSLVKHYRAELGFS
ncbi:hypothetical protein KIPB_013552, partial [Kipferlia bialata]|eukprot:g13552.t1